MDQARPLLEQDAILELMDPQIKNNYSNHEVKCMLLAASLCIRRNPLTRPRMSQVFISLALCYNSYEKDSK